MLQISNVFVNVSKGEVAKHADLQKAFGKGAEIDDIVREVRTDIHPLLIGLHNQLFTVTRYRF